jgi:hypothetical protein
MSGRLAGWALLAIAVFYVLTDSGGAAGFVHAAVHGLESTGRSPSSFLSCR